MLYTSLAEIKSFNPCAGGWRNILAGQRKVEVDDVLFPLTEALDSNSIADVCWLLGKRKTEIQIAVRFARMCADSVAHINNKYARDAATYAAAVQATTDAAAAAAVYAAAVATYAKDAATEAAVAAAVYAATDDVYAATVQKQKNKQFLIQCITE